MGSVVLGAAAALAVPRTAPAGTITSWNYPENDALSDEEIAARFETIDASYEVGETFSDADVEFVLRYATPAPNGGFRQFMETSTHGYGDPLPTDAWLACRTEATYEGDFVYRFAEDAYLATALPGTATIETGITAYGWQSPFQSDAGMCGFGIVLRERHTADKELAASEGAADASGLSFLFSSGDECTGILAGYRVVYRAVVAPSDGGEPVEVGPLDSALAPDSLQRRYRANDDLSEQEASERFGAINDAYEVGETLNAVDSDFVSRYGNSIWDGGGEGLQS